MTRRKFVPRPQVTGEGEPFDSAEHAWLWAYECYLARLEGARVVAGLGAVPRPCEPGDVLTAAMRLFRRRRLSTTHLAVLGEFGRRLAPPDRHARSETEAARRWAEAMRSLGEELRRRGIIA